jgi:hypothetical protein
MLVNFPEKVLNANMNKYKDFITGSGYIHILLLMFFSSGLQDQSKKMKEKNIIWLTTSIFFRPDQGF